MQLPEGDHECKVNSYDFLSHATFRVLAGVGHLSPLERPGELAAACLDLLVTLSAPDGEPDCTRAI